MFESDFLSYDGGSIVIAASGTGTLTQLSQVNIDQYIPNKGGVGKDLGPSQNISKEIVAEAILNAGTEITHVKTNGDITKTNDYNNVSNDGVGGRSA